MIRTKRQDKRQEARETRDETRERKDKTETQRQVCLSETVSDYGVATISRLLKMIGLVCKRAL